MNKINENLFLENLKISNWSLDVSKSIYEILEKPNWAEWLEASINSIEGRSKVFPEGQFLLSNGKETLGSLSTNQIYWDGNPNTLQSWDDIAGDPTTYENTYNKNGNTLVFMSMNINNKFLGLRLTDYLVGAAKDFAKLNGIKHIIGSFRPSGYGKYKLENGYIKFEDYVNLKNNDGFSIDPWLRSLQKKGMKQIKIDDVAMKVELTMEEFLKYKKTNWIEQKPGIWECGEVGNFEVKNDKAIYTEKNVWGELPL
ncbi:MAG: hypothetical protein PHN31_00620 [Candidatus Gracilibacteria bacterium]|nr:hypothetical protein [Candidatus Gracilibacteria bacterium]